MGAPLSTVLAVLLVGASGLAMSPPRATPPQVDGLVSINLGDADQGPLAAQPAGRVTLRLNRGPSDVTEVVTAPMRHLAIAVSVTADHVPYRRYVLRATPVADGPLPDQGAPVTAQASGSPPSPTKAPSVWTEAMAPAPLKPPGRLRRLGSTESFWVRPDAARDVTPRRQTGVLKVRTPHAYIYLDRKAQKVSDPELKALGEMFEKRIRTTVAGVFGEDAQPGIDGENRLFIFITPAMKSGEAIRVSGYFWAGDMMPDRPDLKGSNQKEIILLGDYLFPIGGVDQAGRTLTHEYQHLVSFSLSQARWGKAAAALTMEDGWLTEGLAEHAVHMAGFAVQPHLVRDFLNAPHEFALMDASTTPLGLRKQFSYGMCSLFIRYLAERFGKGILPELTQPDKGSRAALEQSLAARGTSLAEVYQAWSVANFASALPWSKGTPYRYDTVDLPSLHDGAVLPGIRSSHGATGVVRHTQVPWTTAYYRFEAKTAQRWRITLGPDVAAEPGAKQ